MKRIQNGTIHRTALPASLLALLLAGCAAEPSDPTESEPPESNTPDLQFDPSDAIDAPHEIASQTIEIEPNHTLTIRRMSDDSFVLIEEGELDHHVERVGMRAASRTVTEIAKEVAPTETLGTALTAPLDPSIRVLSIPSGQSTLPPKSTTPTVVSGALGANDYATLNCDDPAVTTCYPAIWGAAWSEWNLGGWFRSYAVNRRTDGLGSSFEMHRWNGSADVLVSWYALQPGRWASMQLVNGTQAWMYSYISGASGQVVGLSSLVTSITPRAQEMPMWCWAATGQMLMSYYGQNYEQCTLATNHWNDGRGCCASPVPDICNGGGEAGQPLITNGFGSVGESMSAMGDPNAVAIMLQGGPVWVHHSWLDGNAHYTLLADYREKFVGGVWQPQALAIDPGPAQNYDQRAHASWIPLSDVLSVNGGLVDGGGSSIHSVSRPNLQSAFSRVSWKNNVATAYFDAPGATHFNYQFKDAFSATVWGSGTAYVDPGASWWTLPYGTATLNIGGWLWYKVRVQACNAGGCGAWVETTQVSLKPAAFIDSLVWSGNALTATFHGDPGPTRYRWRFMEASDPSNLKVWRTGENAGTGSSSATFGVGAALWTTFQVQACNSNGCGAWATQRIYTG
jgi:hypothetical protein